MSRSYDAKNWEPSAAMRQVRDDVARAFFVEPIDVVGRSRVQHVVQARNAATWVVRQMFGISWPCVGKVMGGRDHSTVIHAAQRAERRRDEDAMFRTRTDELLARVPLAELTPLPCEVVERFVKPEAEPEPVLVREQHAAIHAARKVRDRNRFEGDSDAIMRHRGTRDLAAAIAASGGGFR